jgi:hypothetical protein
MEILITVLLEVHLRGVPSSGKLILATDDNEHYYKKLNGNIQ